MHRVRSTRRGTRGFSLLEVLIAVVVLSVGLLALAALQGRLTQASAEAKVRGRVAAMLAARMDALRNGGYGALAIGGPTTITSTTANACDNTPADWLDCTREQAALGSLSFTTTVAGWYGAASFTQGTPTDPSVAQFKRVTLGASWQDANGLGNQLQIASDVSSLALVNNVVIPPEPEGSGNSGPIVRTTDPATAGVVPIALGGDGTAISATTNPLPELVGQKNKERIVGTRFTVLNYTPPAGGAVIIQKRFENEVVKCSCRYGSGGTSLPLIYRAAQWPAVWTGDRYDVHVPDPQADAPGQAYSAGPRPGVQQNALCLECCRDHHDTTATGEVKFDPERSDGLVSKYDRTDTEPLLLRGTGTGTTYVDACRLIRIDGFWRTASDLYARQYGLLETRAVAGVAARNGLPTDGAVAIYTGFVKDFLALYDGTQATPPADAQAAFAATSGIDAPAVVDIAQASATDFRYLHGRALYVDHLEEKARTRLQDVIADNGPQGSCPTDRPREDCVMPYLPFTTINLTEIASWIASDEDILTVNSRNLLASDPTQPSGGRTIGKAPGQAENQTSLRASNSGVAIVSAKAGDNLDLVAGVDPTDDSAVLQDAQPFQVGGSSLGPVFHVRVTGGGANPTVVFTLGTDTDRECLKPAGTDHECVTAAGTALPQAGTVRIAGYWSESSVDTALSATCGGQAASATVAVPTFNNYAVTTAVVAGLAGSIALPMADNTQAESTAVSFSAIGADQLVELTLAVQGMTSATIVSCTTTDGTNIDNIVWNKPWAVP
jgi:prepilin-type N-terminal cleavage/methylation domain-containing protein